ncbi:hypothetical protein K8R43_05845 [archaeon]|nr:hypothetical protein [archaeon]
MVEFQITSSLGDATASVKRQGKTEKITVTRNIYEKEIGVRWMNSLPNAKIYKIHRTGHINRRAEIYKGNKKIGYVKTLLGVSNTIKISDGDGTHFYIKEKINPLNRDYDIYKDGTRIGAFQLTGFHFPLFSRTGKGFTGYYNYLKTSEEELLVTSLIALGV